MTMYDVILLSCMVISVGAGACPEVYMKDADPKISQQLRDGILAQNIRENLRNYTSSCHLAGTPGGEHLADIIHATWQQQGLDVVTRSNYDVLLSYPNTTDPSCVQLVDGTGAVIFQSATREKALVPEQNQADVTLPFNAYSPPGDVEGDLVYVNQATLDDFNVLKNKFYVDISGKIAIVRYGDMYRGDQVKLAQRFGAKAVILYSDPADVHPNINDPVFPYSSWMPGTGLQYGAINLFDGDLLTPGYPATDTAYRLPENKAPGLPLIPVHPIGYDDAFHLMSKMAGESVKDKAPLWQGGMNFTYRVGPGYTETGMKAKLHVTSKNRRANITNVFGIINGTVEPDRYVLLGNHRDAWVFGGVDPTSGTAVMMELSRVMMSLVHKGWRPRRSIVFCSWDAEEFSLTGSYEWVEDYVKLLADRAVAYLNCDYAVDGTMSLTADTVSLLQDVVYDAAKKVKVPDDSGQTTYEQWLAVDPGPHGLPELGSVTDDSDYAAFVFSAGVPTYDVWYSSGEGYVLYHSGYDTFTNYKLYMDPDFKYARAVGQFWGETAYSLADSLILPLNASALAETLKDNVGLLQADFGSVLAEHGITLDGLRSAVEQFKQAAKSFHLCAANIRNNTNPLLVWAYNDQLMMLPRAFIDPLGLPLRPFFKNELYAPSTIDSYQSSTFPGLVDLMSLDDAAKPDVTERWELFRQHLATIIFCVKTATKSLAPLTDFIHN